MRWFLTALVTVALGAPASAFPQTPADSAAIRATALDYIEGWYTGDPVRMERALHPELVKRILVVDQEHGFAFLDQMGKSRLVGGTRAGFGREVPQSERRTDVAILDLRTALDVTATPYAIPGSRWIAAEALDAQLADVPRDRELVLYCS